MITSAILSAARRQPRKRKTEAELKAKKQQRAINKVVQDHQNFDRIKALNVEHIKAQTSIELPPVGPDRKSVVVVEENQRAAWRLEDYVRVEADFSPGKNRHAGFGFVKSTKGVGPATLATVKYQLADGGLLFHVPSLLFAAG